MTSVSCRMRHSSTLLARPENGGGVAGWRIGLVDDVLLLGHDLPPATQAQGIGTMHAGCTEGGNDVRPCRQFARSQCEL